MNKFIILLMIKRNTKKELIQKFEDAINFFSLKFKDPNVEQSFIDEKLEYSKMRLLSLSFFFLIWGFMLLGLRPLQLYFQKTNELNPVNTGIPPTINLVNFIVVIASIIIEIIIFFIRYLSFVRGYFSSLSGVLFLIYVSYLTQTNLKGNAMYLQPSILPCLINSISISMIYSHNWIHGSLILCIICFSYQIFLFCFSTGYFDKFLTCLIIIFVCIVYSICLRIIEYFQRESFFVCDLAIKQMENSEQILENLPEPIVITENNHVVFSNQSLRSINLKKNEIRRTDPSLGVDSHPENLLLAESILSNLYHSESAKPLIEFISNNIKIPLHSIFVHKDNIKRKEKPFEIISNEISYGNRSQIVYALKNQYYYSKVQESKSKEKYSRIFISSISHNIRTPLNMIEGNIDLLYYKVIDYSLKLYCTNILNGSQLLNILIDNLLDYSKIMSDTFQIFVIPFNLRKEFNKIYSLFHSKFEDKNLFFHFEFDENFPLTVFSDPKRITQILVCLISNALNFTLVGGVKIKIKYNLMCQKVKVSVADTGIGISKNNFNNIFQIYGKIDDPMNLNSNGMNN